MIEKSIIQGRTIGPAELAQIRQLQAAYPQWGRSRLSIAIAQMWDWRNAAGRLKDMAARTLLLKLEKRGWLKLPPPQSANGSRMRKRPESLMELPMTPLIQPLAQLLPLRIMEISAKSSADQRTLFEALLRQHHYLSHRGAVGENLQYLVRDRLERPVACLLFGASAWQCADRDRHIGWNSSARTQRLHYIANNARFLIPPWVRVPQLASHLLSRIAQRLSNDWQAKYGHPIYLLETFVERNRFVGTCYRAANWVRVGQTKGRSRQDRSDGKPHQVPIKDIYLYPLHARFQELLQGTLIL